MLNYTQILDIAGKLIYVILGLSAVAGIFLVILLILRIAQKRFASLQAEEDFSANVRDLIVNKDLEGLTQYCDSPDLFSKAAPQLVLLAIANPQPPQRMRQFLSEKFERDVLADIDYRSQWVSTIVKSAPMLGLLGTVIGMINAFAKIAAMKETGMDPSVLAKDISFALFTTAMGLSVAIPLVMAGAAINIRVAKLQDSVQHTIGDFLAAWESQLPAKGGES